MAADKNASQLHRREQDSGLAIPQAVQITGKGAELDLGKRLQDLAQRASAAASQSTPGLDLRDFGLSGQGLALAQDLNLAGGLARRLQKAKALLQQEKYSEALEEIEAALDEDPYHHEAIYLKAFCLVHTGECVAAFRVLRPLLAARLDRSLAVQIEKLRGTARGPLQAELLFELLAGGPQGMTIRLAELVELDPEYGMFRHMLAMCLALQEQFIPAWQVLRDGLDLVSPSERQSLQELADALLPRALEAVLAPVIENMRRGENKKALQALSGIDGHFSDCPELKVLNSYLKGASGGGLFSFLRGRGKKPITLNGPAKAIDNVQGWILRKEVRQGVKLLAEMQFPQAERVFRQGMQLLPDYPYLNYLLATCIYNGAAKALEEGKIGGPEQLQAILLEAKKLAEVGVTDPEIDGAPGMLKNIIEVMGMFAKAAKEHDILDKHFKAFQNYMNHLNSGKAIRSRSDLDKAIAEVGRMAREVNEDKNRLASADARKTMDMLSERLSQLGDQLRNLGR